MTRNIFVATDDHGKSVVRSVHTYARLSEDYGMPVTLTPARRASVNEEAEQTALSPLMLSKELPEAATLAQLRNI